MDVDHELREFDDVIKEAWFPKTLLEGDGAVAKLKADFLYNPIQFTKRVMHAAHQERFAFWYTPPGQEILGKLGLKVDDMRM